MKYKSIFFDLDDTLWNFTENAYDSFVEIYQLHQLNRYFDSFEHFYTLYNECNRKLWLDYGNGIITKEYLNNERFLYPLKAVGVDDHALAKAYSTDFFQLIPYKTKLLPHAIEVLDYLFGKYRLFILSNGFRELQYIKMRSSGIEHYFEKVILSDDIQIHKPYPEIFNFALSSTQSVVNQSLMIGDNWDADIAGAKGVGMDQLFFNHSFREELPFLPTYSVNNLKEIIEILARK